MCFDFLNAASRYVVRAGLKAAFLEEIQIQGSLEQQALLIIDQQKQICDPAFGKHATKKTYEIAKQNARLAEEFRKANISRYIIYLDPHQKGYQNAYGGLCLIEPHASDTLVAKKNDSAFFDSSDIEQFLKRAQKKYLWVIGFNARACVRETVLDAVYKGYEVNVIRDCVGDDERPSIGKVDLEGLIYTEWALKKMSEKANLVHSWQVRLMLAELQCV